MATGDQQDLTSRLRALLPNGWFSSESPVLQAVLQGPANALSWIYGLWAYAKLQTRIKTATDGFLDMISQDFFGGGLLRRTNENDVNFSARIIANLLPERATRNGMVQALLRLTGNTPTIIEPGNVFDCICYDIGTGGYDVAGVYGELDLNAQSFLQIALPAGAGIANVDGWNGYLGGYGVGAIEWVNPAMTQGEVTETDIYNTINATKPEGTIVWTNIS